MPAARVQVGIEIGHSRALSGVPGPHKPLWADNVMITDGFEWLILTSCTSPPRPSIQYQSQTGKRTQGVGNRRKTPSAGDGTGGDGGSDGGDQMIDTGDGMHASSYHDL